MLRINKYKYINKKRKYHYLNVDKVYKVYRAHIAESGDIVNIKLILEG